jgi:uncharacterized protein (DUF58 family)
VAVRESLVRRAVFRTPLLDALVYFHRERLTARGRYLLWTTVAFALLGLDALRSQAFLLFAAAAGVLMVALLFTAWPRPRARFDCALPARATAGRPVRVRATVESTSRQILPHLRLSFPRPRRGAHAVIVSPQESFLGAGRGAATEAWVELLAPRRGRYEIPGPRLRVTDPLRLAAGNSLRRPDQVLLAYPRFYRLEDFEVPVGRRYQPGGIPLSSNTGDAIEFLGTREYREGDAVRNIHWRSWARCGEPVVKEYQEEYFCRIAILLDTYAPRRPRAAETRAFEAAISMVASVADFFSRSEHIVDLLAAGPDLYEVSAGRSLAYLENILDVLACLEPSPDPPFRTLGPVLFEKLARITTVVAVLQDWDEPREAFLRQVKALGTAVRVIIVHEGPTARDLAAAPADLGEISRMTPADVEQALLAGGG